MNTVALLCTKKAKKKKLFNELREDLQCFIQDDAELAPDLVRLAWHQAATYGNIFPQQPTRNRQQNLQEFVDQESHQLEKISANAASTRFKPECEYPCNRGLGRCSALLDVLYRKYNKTAMVQSVDVTLSYADLWALAGTVAIESMGGPKIPFRYGRKDALSTTQCNPDGRLPDTIYGNEEHFRAVFGKRMGFTDRETVALLGGLHNSDNFLKDNHSRWSNAFFLSLLAEQWIYDANGYTDLATQQLRMSPSDLVLITDPIYRQICSEFAQDKATFDEEFAAAFQKLIELGSCTTITGYV